MEYIKPEDIEKRSFEIIRQELARPIDPVLAPLILRVIHTTADFEYADTLSFSESVVEHAVTALRQGAKIISDTSMVMAGVDKTRLRALGGDVHCFIGDADVAEAARQNGSTRARAAVDKAAGLMATADGRDGTTGVLRTACPRDTTAHPTAKSDAAKSVEEIGHPFIFAIGNAPTALLRIVELHEAGLCKPALVIGVPVGFVNVVESKEALMRSGLPFIAARGRKGGSNVAAALCNALLRIATDNPLPPNAIPE